MSAKREERVTSPDIQGKTFLGRKENDPELAMRSEKEMHPTSKSHGTKLWWRKPGSPRDRSAGEQEDNVFSKESGLHQSKTVAGTSRDEVEVIGFC